MGWHNLKKPETGYVHGNNEAYLAVTSSGDINITFANGHEYKMPDALLHYVLESGLYPGHQDLSPEFIKDLSEHRADEVFVERDQTRSSSNEAYLSDFQVDRVAAQNQWALVETETHPEGVSLKGFAEMYADKVLSKIDRGFEVIGLTGADELKGILAKLPERDTVSVEQAIETAAAAIKEEAAERYKPQEQTRLTHALIEAWKQRQLEKGHDPESEKRNFRRFIDANIAVHAEFTKDSEGNVQSDLSQDNDFQRNESNLQRRGESLYDKENVNEMVPTITDMYRRIGVEVSFPNKPRLWINPPFDLVCDDACK